LDRNFLLAFALSFLVIALWMSIQPAPAPPPPDEVEAARTEERLPAEASPEDSEALPEWEPSPRGDAEAPFEPSSPAVRPYAPPGTAARTVIVSTERFEAELSSRGGTLVRFELRHFHDASDPAHPPVGLATGDPTLPGPLATPFRELGLGDWSFAEFDVTQPGLREVVFTHTREDVTVRKAYRFEEGTYAFRVELTIENGTDRTLEPIFEAVWPAAAQETADFREFSLAAYRVDGVERLRISGQGGPGAGCGPLGGGGDARELVGDVSWAGADTRYFIAAMIPEVAEVSAARFLPIEDERLAVVTVAQKRIQLQPGARHSYEYLVYAGPKIRSQLEEGGLGAAHLEAAIQTGWSWIAPLTRFFSWLLASVYQYVPNYGLVIILITVLVRLVTAPLLGRQMRSMKKMSQQMADMKPRLDAIKEKYGDDRQRMSEETMKAYREAGVNPFGMLSGCLPLLLQFPVFIGLFYALQSSIELRQAPFVAWIDDLSAPESLLTIPGLELPLRVLPLVMGASMFLQQKLTPQTSMDPAQQRMMLTLMPVMFTVLFYQFPSGLVLYWMVSNFLASAHQLWINRNPA